MTFKTASTEPGAPVPRLLRAAAGSHDDVPSIVPPAVKADGTDDQPATPPSAPLPTDPTRTAQSVAAPTTQPAVAPALFRAPERYQILNEHGRGGLGRVSRAHDRELGRDVAIKELISRSSIAEVRFLREAMITARLEHPGIVPMYEAGRWPDGTPYYAMKLVSGRPLRELIAERRTVDQRIGLLHHVIAVADAIAYAHGRNIIHRDLKPANVIVGDFGETIVIDWGLAKDLSSSEEPTIAGGPSHSPSGNDLTAVGAVLGTPLYMAPEQERGEHVDQRADVFAIGAMLWEVCSLEKAPPANLRQRHRLLRHAGIDHDLAVIVDKALEPDPGRRYPDAGALAADLKAFKAGARIAARSYSLWARLVHWGRRHRTLALAIATATALSAAGIALYVRNIAAERDRADTSENAAIASLNELTLKHAELLLTTDPSAALDAIASYRGVDTTRAGQTRAAAVGRGVATLRAVPHTDIILWVRGISSGDIVSLSMDGTIARTSPEGGSKVIANDVKKGSAFSYAASRHLLAYVCDPNDLCFLDVVTGKHIRTPHDFDYSLLALSFSPDETRLAVISESGDLRIVDVASPAVPKEILHVHSMEGGGVLFVESDSIAIGTADGLKLVHLNGNIDQLIDPEGTLWELVPNSHQLALATSTGHVYFADTSHLHATAHTPLCNDPVSGLKAIPKRGLLAFACKEGTVGLVDAQSRTVTFKAHIGGHANLLEADASGDYLVAAGDKGTLAVIDLKTHITTSLIGQGFRLTAIAPPTDEYPYFLSADVRGGIRAWARPHRAVKVLADAQSKVYSVLYRADDRSLVIDTRNSDLFTYTEGVGLKTVTHLASNTPFLRASVNRGVFAAYGASPAVEIWSLSTLVRQQILDTHHGTVSHVEFTRSGEDLITAGKDGRVVRWSSDGQPHEIHRFNQPIDTFVQLTDTETIIAATHDGILWLISRSRKPAALWTMNARVAVMLALPDRISVGVGYTDGTALILNTQTLQHTLPLRAADAIRDIAVSADGRLIAFAGNDNLVRLGLKEDEWSTIMSTELATSIRRIALTMDGLLIAICTDGTVWLYSSARRTWLCLLTSTTELVQLTLDSKEATAFIFDIDGHLMSIDLDESRRILGTKQ